MSKILLPSQQDVLSTWNHTFIRDKHLPKLPGVYILVSNEVILYIGTSKSIRCRVYRLIHDHPIKALVPLEHSTSFQNIRLYLFWNYSLKVYYKLFDKKERKQRYQLERQLINKLEPVLNDPMYRQAVERSINQKSA